MSSELETAGAASVGGLGSGGKADLTGQPCRNCGEMVELRHCPACGQLAASFHRPFFSLVVDSISDAFAFDSRVARTMPLLLFRPGALTRRYNEGKRARYVPPFRLFLLSSLVFYFLVFGLLDSQEWMDSPININIEGDAELTEEEAAELRENLQSAGINISEARIREFVRENAESPELDETGSPATPAEPDVSSSADAEEAAAVPDETSDFEERLKRIADNPKLFSMALQTWAPRLSLLMVPMTMLALALMYFWKRKIYIYNHAIHALHLQTWMYLAGTLTILAGTWFAGGIAPALFFIILPIYVLLSLRGAYGTGFFLSFVRMVFLLTFWTIGMSLLTAFAFFASILSV